MSTGSGGTANQGVRIFINLFSFWLNSLMKRTEHFFIAWLVVFAEICYLVENVHFDFH